MLTDCQETGTQSFLEPCLIFANDEWLFVAEIKQGEKKGYKKYPFVNIQDIFR